ncbi:MAG: hypothetical protein KBT79_13700, partial [Thalassolituus oleivorans]|nr:hypothetical protein [Thalassolituus oleivorans]
AKPVDSAAETAVVGEKSADSATTETAKDYNYAAETDPKAAVEPSAEAANAEAEAIKARKERIAKLLAAEEAAKAKDKSILDQVMEFRDELMIGGGALLIGLLVLVGLRRRKKSDDNTQDETADFDEEPVVMGDGKFDNETLDNFDLSDDDLAVAETNFGDEDLGLDEFAEEDEGKYETVAQTEDAISESEIYIAYGKFDQAIDLLSSAIESEPSRTDLRLKLLELYTEVDDAEAFAKAEGELSELGDIIASTQAEDLRKRLSSPLDPMVAGAAVVAGAMSLDDGQIPSLDDENDEFAGGLDFGDALDFGDDTETVADDGLGKSLEEVPSLDLDANVDFDVASEGPQLSLDKPDLDDEFDSESDDLEFDVEESVELAEKKADDELDEFDFDLGDDADEPLEFDEPAVTEVAAIKDELVADDFDFAEDEMEAELDLETIDFAEEPDAVVTTEVEDEELDSEDDDLVELAETTAEAPASEDDVLAFDMDAETGFESDDSDVDLQSLEAELDAIGTEAADAEIVSGADDLDEAMPMADVQDDLAEAEDDLAEFDLAIADDAEANDDIEVATEDDDLSILDGLSAGEDDSAAELIGGIDLDELAASDDEFDFLAGTDECATKLDLARAYIDMEDVDGAKELLQEVVQEGSDQQKQDARELMDNLA